MRSGPWRRHSRRITEASWSPATVKLDREIKEANQALNAWAMRGSPNELIGRSEPVEQPKDDREWFG